MHPAPYSSNDFHMHGLQWLWWCVGGGGKHTKHSNTCLLLHWLCSKPTTSFTQVTGFTSSFPSLSSAWTRTGVFPSSEEESRFKISKCCVLSHWAQGPTPISNCRVKRQIFKANRHTETFTGCIGIVCAHPATAGRTYFIFVRSDEGQRASIVSRTWGNSWMVQGKEKRRKNRKEEISSILQGEVSYITPPNPPYEDNVIIEIPTIASLRWKPHNWQGPGWHTE